MSKNSDYWLGDYSWDFSDEPDDASTFDFSTSLFDGYSQYKDNFELIKLASARRAVANYVEIMTGKHIPVKFSTRGSYTDGETVTISSDINQSDKFDVVVGLALHESSHILFTDFEAFRNIGFNINELYDVANSRDIPTDRLADFSRNILNYIEDRYIDQMSFNKAPGYRGYYRELYKHYFLAKSVDKGIKSLMYRIPTMDSYEFRIINLINANTDLDALPGLREIHSILDLANIIRLETQPSRIECMIKVVTVILNNMNVDLAQQGQGQGQGQG